MASRVDSVVNLSKRRGFVFPSSDIYGGTRSAWDYGPLGVELKENVRRQWWQHMVRGRDDVVGIDSSVILAPQVWVASGHVDAFVDPLTDRVALIVPIFAIAIEGVVPWWLVRFPPAPPGGKRLWRQLV